MVGRAKGGPNQDPAPPYLTPCLLDGLQHHLEEDTVKALQQHQQQEIEAVGCLGNASILEGAWARAGKEPMVQKGVGAGTELLFPPLTVEKKPRFGEEQRRGKAALTLVRHQHICELMAPHVNSGIRGLRCPQAAGKEGMGQAGVLARGRPTPPCRLRAWWAHHSQREAEDAAPN